MTQTSWISFFLLLTLCVVAEGRLAARTLSEEEDTTSTPPPTTNNSSRTIHLSIKMDFGFFDNVDLAQTPPSEEAIQGLLVVTQEFFTKEMEADPVFEGDFVSFHLDPHAVSYQVLDAQDNSTMEESEEYKDATTLELDPLPKDSKEGIMLELWVEATIELTPQSEQTDEQAAMTLPGYDLSRFVTRHVWRSNPWNKQNVFHQAHWVVFTAFWTKVVPQITN